MRMALAVVAALMVAAPARAEYPERPIRLLVAAETGSSLDTAARLVAPYLQKHLDFDGPVTVENRPASAGGEAYATVAAARADGHVLALAVLPDMVTLSIQGAATYEPRAIALLGAIGLQPAVVVTDRDRPWRSVDDLVAAAGGASPIRIGVTDPGSAAALAARRLFAAPGVRATLVAFDTEAGLRGALAAGTVSAAALGKPTAIQLGSSVRLLSGSLGEPLAVLTLAAPSGLTDEVATTLRQAARAIARDKAFAYAAAARGIEPIFLSAGNWPGSGRPPQHATARCGRRTRG